MVIPVDFNALANLRPGEGKEMLARALGSRWREPGPHQQGLVKSIANVHGFLAQIDTSDHIGAIYFHEPFPNIEIAGLRFGMPTAAALAKRPELKEAMRLPVYESVHYSAEVSSHYRMLVEFRWGKLYQIGFRNPQAVYPDKQPKVYPPAAGAPGAPFADPNFKLAVLSSLLDNDALDLGSYQDLASHVLNRPIDLEQEGYKLLPQAYDYLVRYPLTGDDLALVESIVFDGGNAIYPYCYRFWGGETTEFDVKSVAGISHCPNVRSIISIAVIEKLDIAQLTGLAKLEELSLSTDTINLQRLLDLPALKKVQAYADAIDPLLVTRLRAKGVTVRLVR
jgi:hypothetical protein